MQVWIVRRVKDRVIMSAYDNPYDANKTATRIEDTFHEFMEVITVNVRESEDEKCESEDEK